MSTISQVIDKLSKKVLPKKVWYQIAHDGTINIGVDDLIYYKIKDNFVVWESLY